MPYTESEIGMVSSKTKSRVWGQLLLHPAALISPAFSIDLIDRTYTVGRLTDCNFSISGQNVSSKRILKHISRRHFVLRKHMVSGLLIVQVTDLSFNGTFVNGRRIGKNNTFTLFDGDSLAIGLPSFKIFTFRDLCNGTGNTEWRNCDINLSPDIMDLEAELTEDSSLIHIYNEPHENHNFTRFRPPQ